MLSLAAVLRVLIVYECYICSLSISIFLLTDTHIEVWCNEDGCPTANYMAKELEKIYPSDKIYKKDSSTLIQPNGCKYSPSLRFQNGWSQWRSLSISSLLQAPFVWQYEHLDYCKY